MAVTYLRLFPAVNQFELRNGMLNVAGRLYVYYQGTDDLADIYDEDGTQLQQPAILDSDGRAPGLFVDSARVYWLKVCDRYDDQQYTVEKMVPSGGGAGSALGTEVSIVSTDGSLTIDENTSGGVKTFDIAVSEDSTQLLEWCKLSGLNTLASDGDLAFSFAAGNMAVEGGQLKLRDDSYYHITTHFAVKPDAQGIGYDTLTFTLYKVDSENNTLLLRTFTYDVDSSVSDMVEVEYSTDVMTDGDLKVYWNVTGIADGITVTIGDAQVHRVYSGIPRLPESSYATEEWVTDNFQPIGDYQPSGDYLSATESANYLLTSQSGMFQPSGNYQTAGDYLSATESANYLLTSQSGLFQTVDGMSAYQPSGDYAFNSALSSKLDTTAQVVTSTAGADGYLTAVNGLPVSAGTDLATVSSIASSYAESAASGKLDNSASSTFYSTGNPSGFITGVDLTPYQLTADMSGYLQTSESSNYYSTSNPSGFITGVDLSDYATTGYVDSSVSGKLDASVSSTFYTTANESGFITGVDLTPYQLTAYMSGYLTTGESANYYSTSNPSGFLTSETVTSLGTASVMGVGTALTSVNDLPLSASMAYHAEDAVTAHYDDDGRALTSLASRDELSAYLTTGESANYLLTSQSGMFQPSGNYQPSGDYLSATESANYYLTSNPSGFVTTAIIGIGEI